MVKEIISEEFESEVLGADVPVLVDFWAEWCSPCRMMGPVFKELSSEIGSQMKFFKLNVETRLPILPCAIHTTHLNRTLTKKQ